MLNCIYVNYTERAACKDSEKDKDIVSIICKMTLNASINVIFLCIINGVFLITGTFLNSVVIISLWKSSKLRKKISCFMILVLSCFDLVVVSTIHPIVLLVTLSLAFQGYNELLLQVATFIVNNLYGFAMFALLTLNLERFLSITRPIFHRTYVTRRRLLSVLALLQLLTVVLSTFCFQELLIPDYIVVNVVLVTLLSLFVYLNCSIFLVAKQHRENNVSNVVSPCSDDRKKKKKLILLEFKKAFTCFLAVICFLLCSLPGIVISWLCLAWNTPLYDEKVLHLTLWMPTISSMNATFNCLILFWKNQLLRHEGMKTIKCFQPARA